METLKLKEWKKQANELFGEDIRDWQFVCVQCGEVQTLREFEKNAIENAKRKFYFSCIGRSIKGRGCNWSLGGLFRIHKVEVIDENNEHVPVFEFNKPDIKKATY